MPVSQSPRLSLERVCLLSDGPRFGWGRAAVRSKRGLDLTCLRTRSRSQHQLVVSQRVALVRDPPPLGETTMRVERARSRDGIVGVQANGVRRPSFGDHPRVFEGQAAETLALV